MRTRVSVVKAELERLSCSSTVPSQSEVHWLLLENDGGAERELSQGDRLHGHGWRPGKVTFTETRVQWIRVALTTGGAGRGELSHVDRWPVSATESRGCRPSRRRAGCCLGHRSHSRVLGLPGTRPVTCCDFIFRASSVATDLVNDSSGMPLTHDSRPLVFCAPRLFLTEFSAIAL